MADILARQRQQQIMAPINPAQLEKKRQQDQIDKAAKETAMQGQAPENLEARQRYFKEKAKIDTEIANFEAENIKLTTGEWMPRADYDKLSDENKKQINDLGVDKFNIWATQQYNNQVAELKKNYTELNTGEWVDKTYYNSLPAEWRNEIKARGVDGWQAWWDTKPYGGKTEFVEGTIFGQERIFGKTSDPLIGIDASGMNVYLGDTWPEHIIRYTGNPDTSPGYKEAQGKPLVTAGVTLPSIFEKRDELQAKIKSGELVQTVKGELISKDTYDSLPIKYQEIIKSQGVDAANKQLIREMAMQPELSKTVIHDTGNEELIKQQEQFTKDNMKLSDGNWVSVKDFYEMPEPMRIEALEKGIDAIDLEKLPPEKQFDKMKSWGMIEKNMEYGGTDESGQIILKDGTLLWEKLLTVETAKDIGIGMIPIAGTMYHWEKSQWWENGLSVALDVATFIPFVGAVSTGIRAGAKGGKAISKIVGRAVLAEAKAPFTAIAHPIATAKTALYPLETALRPSKIPLTAMEIRYSTVRLPVKDVGKATDAMKARDIITKNAIMGDKPTIEIAGTKIELGKVALQQKSMPIAVHTSQDIRPFLNGATVESGREGGLFLSSSFHSRFSQASAFGDLTEGGVPGAIFIRDKEILKQMQPSSKIYRGTAEIEMKLPAGVKLPPPSQVIMSRDAAGRKLAIAIIGDPLSPGEIARLKIQGSIDLVKDIFRPAIKVGDKGVEYVDEIGRLGKEARSLESELVAARKANKLDDVKRIQGDIKGIDQRARVLAQRIDSASASRTSLRAGALSTGEFIDRLAYNEAARTKPAELADALREASTSERNRIMNQIDNQYRPAVQRELSRAVSRIPKANTVERLGLSTESRDIIPSVDRITRTPDRITGRTERVPPVTRTTDTTRPVMLTRTRPIEKVTTETIPRIVPVPSAGKGDYESLTKVQKEGAIAWKQGFIYKLWYPPYGQADIINTTDPIPGVKYKTGLGSAAASITVIKGTIPERGLERDMGIQDVGVMPGRRGRKKPRITFTPDPKQRTKYSGISRMRIL